jgi:DNA-binding CsgD family transcriptional regulator
LRYAAAVAETDPVAERRQLALVMALFVGIAAIIGTDLAWDYIEGVGVGHVGVEGSVIAMALAGAGWAGRRLSALRRDLNALRIEAAALRGEADELRTRLAAESEEAARWRAEAKDLVAGLASAIDREFDRWGLSPAEREIGLLLLKGLSHHEVADLRGVSERTVRQQARSLYKKAGLSGRADLAAYFLEDLLLPTTPARPADSPTA